MIILGNSLFGPEIKRKRKVMIKLFKECDLNITIPTSLRNTNVEMNLDSGT